MSRENPGEIIEYSFSNYLSNLKPLKVLVSWNTNKGNVIVRSVFVS